MDKKYLKLFLDPIKKCKTYKPKLGTNDKSGVDLSGFKTLYGEDPFYAWIGLDSDLMYAAHKAAGGMTSVYRQIGERFDTANTNTVPIADFLVTPVIDVKQDKRYTGEPIPFELKVENHFQTFGWGQNPYRIVCGSFTNETVLMQMK